jgi:hypothetical protein
MFLRSSLSVSLILLSATLITAADKEETKPESYIKVTAKGTLKTGIVAIGGETTGIILTTKDGVLELDIKDKELRKKAEGLSGKVVTVTGNLTIRPGVEVNVRHIVTVESIKANDEK